MQHGMHIPYAIEFLLHTGYGRIHYSAVLSDQSLVNLSASQVREHARWSQVEDSKNSFTLYPQVQGLMHGRWFSGQAASTQEPREAMEYDVCIVGAGPAGLSAAIRLKQVPFASSECTCNMSQKFD